MDAETHSVVLSFPSLRLTGLGLIFLALMHVGFPRYFKWKEELRPLMQVNREMFIVHTVFIAVVLVLMGLPMLVAPQVLLERSGLGAWAGAGFCFFWLLRLIIQWFGYSWSLWRGKRFETIIHFLFTGLWFWLALVGWKLWRHQITL